MGYSASAKALEVYYAIEKVVNPKAVGVSNGLPNGGFYEIGRENPSGAITGKVFRPLTVQERIKWPETPKNGMMRAGGFRISPDGNIERFPGLPSEIRKKAEEIGLATYKAKFERLPSDWRDYAKLLAGKLEHGDQDDQMRARAYWPQVEKVAGQYQRETGVAFLALPEATIPAMTKFLMEIVA